MYPYDVAVYSSGGLIDEIRVSADNALKACEQVEKTHTQHVGRELVARRVLPAGNKYTNYYGMEITA